MPNAPLEQSFYASALSEHQGSFRVPVQEFIEDGIVRPITSEWGAPALLVPKPKGGYRLVVDLRELNRYIPHDVYEPPSCDLCLE